MHLNDVQNNFSVWIRTEQHNYVALVGHFLTSSVIFGEDISLQTLLLLFKCSKR